MRLELAALEHQALVATTYRRSSGAARYTDQEKTLRINLTRVGCGCCSARVVGLLEREVPQ